MGNFIFGHFRIVHNFTIFFVNFKSNSCFEKKKSSILISRVWFLISFNLAEIIEKKKNRRSLFSLPDSDICY